MKRHEFRSLQASQAFTLFLTTESEKNWISGESSVMLANKGLPGASLSYLLCINIFNKINSLACLNHLSSLSSTLPIDRYMQVPMHR